MAVLKALRVFALLVVALVSLPASAATKSITLTGTPASLSAGTQTVSVTINNTGNSNGNSFEVDWTSSSAFNVTAAKIQGTAVAGTLIDPGRKGAGWKGAVFSYQSPQKTSVTIDLTVNVSAGCGSASIDWYAFTWTGAPSTPSQSFPLTNQPTQTALPQVTCTLQFITTPAAALAGSKITNTAFNIPPGVPVTVQALKNGSPASTPVNLTSSTACAISGGSGTTDGGTGFVEFPNLKSNATTDVSCALTASATGYQDAGPVSFDIKVPTGILGCPGSGSEHAGTLDPDDPTTYVGSGAAGDTGLVRGSNTGPNQDGSLTCTPIPYLLTVNLNDSTVSFIADKLGQNILVEMVVMWPEVTVDPTPSPVYDSSGVEVGNTAGFTLKRPWFSWGIENPQFPAHFVPGLACVKDDLTIGLAVFPTNPAVKPFLGNMTTNSEYQPGATPAACIAQHGWTAVGLDGSGKIKVQYWSKIINRDLIGKNP